MDRAGTCSGDTAKWGDVMKQLLEIWCKLACKAVGHRWHILRGGGISTEPCCRRCGVACHTLAVPTRGIKSNVYYANGFLESVEVRPTGIYRY